MSETFSEFLNLIEIRGASWCRIDLGAASGFSVPQNEALFFYAALRGTVRIASGGEQAIDLESGDVVFLLSGEAHAVRNSPSASVTPIKQLRPGVYGDQAFHIDLTGGDHPSTRLVCGRLKPQWPSGIVRKMLPGRVMLPADQAIVLPRAIEEACSGVGSAALLTRIASLLLTDAMRRDPHCEDLFLHSAENDPIGRARQLIDRHFVQPWTVASLARSVGMGRSNFAARFASEAGRSPMKVLAERRMHVAAELLASNALKIADVAARVGYASEAAFSRCFAETHGTTPGRVRSGRVAPSID